MLKYVYPLMLVFVSACQGHMRWDQLADLGQTRDSPGYRYDPSTKYDPNDPNKDRSYGERSSKYLSAAKAGNPAAQFELAKNIDRYAADSRSGYGEAGERALAASWYRRSADQGFVPAQNKMGELYYYGGNRLPVDREKGKRYWEMAAAGGNLDARRSLEQIPAMEAERQRRWANDPVVKAATGMAALSAASYAYCKEHGCTSSPAASPSYDYVGEENKRQKEFWEERQWDDFHEKQQEMHAKSMGWE